MKLAIRSFLVVATLGLLPWPGLAIAAPPAGQVAAGSPQTTTPRPAGPSFEEYVQDLSSTDPDTRVRALRALAASGYPESLAPISALLTDPLDAIQLETLQAVLGYYVPDVPSGTRRVALVVERRSKGGSAERAFDLGPFAVLPTRTPPALLTGLAGAVRDDNPAVRVEAAYTIGVVGRPPLDGTTTTALQGGLRDSVPAMRVATARVLGGLRASAAADALIAAMNDPDADVRAAAMLALGDLREARAVQALMERYEYHKTGPLAEAALDALARIGHATSAPLFQSQLFNRNAVIRRRAAEGLARIGRPEIAVGVEAPLATERRADVQLARAFALQVAGKDHLDQLVGGLGRPATEMQAMSYLVELGRPIAPSLARYLQDPAPAIRSRVAMVLGLLGGDEAIAALEGARRETDLEAARAIERALTRARSAQS